MAMKITLAGLDPDTGKSISNTYLYADGNQNVQLAVNEFGRQYSGLIVYSVITEFGYVDELYEKACKHVVTSQTASVSYLQRFLKIDYNRSVTLLTRMFEDGVVSEVDENGVRHVNVPKSILSKVVIDAVIPESGRQKSFSYNNMVVQVVLVDFEQTNPELIIHRVTGETARFGRGDGHYPLACDYIIGTQQASVIELCLYLSIDYSRALLLLRAMVEEGLVSEPDDNENRHVLVAENPNSA